MARVYTTGQVAKIFNVNINTVIKWFDEGKLGGFRLPRSQERRIYRDSLVAFMASHDIAPDLLHAYDDERASRRRKGQAPPVGPPASPAGAELRTFPRKPVDLRGVVLAGERQVDVHVRNLSMGGAYLTDYQVGSEKVVPTEFRLRMRTEQSTLDGFCQVVHLRRVEDGRLALGCRFTQVDPSSIQRYLQTV